MKKRRSVQRRPHSRRLLWAPWRYSYIAQANKQKSCLFCRIVLAKQDRKNLVVIRRKHSFAVLNRYPYNNGHVMLVPQRHVRTLGPLKDEELVELVRLQEEMIGRLSRCLKPHGFNIGMNLGRVGGAGVPGHVHIHLVPRWVGDNNFMPTIAATKVISQSLAALYRQLISV